jgi:imidazolonepropionase-like amidohydrolase
MCAGTRFREQTMPSIVRRALALLLLVTGCATRPSAPRSEAPSSADPGFVVVGATVFDGERFRSGNVHVVGAAIVGFVDAPPPGARRIEGRGHTLLPGLLDGHTHVGTTVEHLTRFLGFGVTTVVDLFGPPELLRELRASDLSRTGLARASLFGAGNVATAPKGHGTEYGIPIPTLERPDEAAAFVAARKAEGSDVLKIIFDTSTTDVGGQANAMPTLSLDTVRALVREAHDQGLVAVAHAGGCDDLRSLVDTGVDVLAHGCAIEEDDALPRRLAERKVFFNPTLAVQLRPCGMEYWIPLVEDPDVAARLTEEERKRLGTDRKDHNKDCSERRMRLVGRAAKEGVRIVAGPDAPNRRIPVGASLLAELDLIHRAGATVEQTLAAATSNVADAYRIRDRGRIAPKQRADLLLVAGDARSDLRAVWKTRAVWKAGVRVVER